jgi:hypothetical protein
MPLEVGGALAAEIEFRRILERALRAIERERSSALPAKLHAGGIIELALWTAHPNSNHLYRWRQYRQIP